MQYLYFYLSMIVNDSDSLIKAASNFLSLRDITPFCRLCLLTNWVLILKSASFLSYTSAHIGVTLRRSPSLSDHERRKIVGILVVITVNFIVVFGPYHLVGGYRFVSLLLTDEPCGLERSIFLTYRLCYGLTSLNTLLDPLFYIFLCADARLELQRSLPCLGRGQNTGKKIALSTRARPDNQRGSGSGHNNLLEI